MIIIHLNWFYRAFVFTWEWDRQRFDADTLVCPMSIYWHWPLLCRIYCVCAFVCTARVHIKHFWVNVQDIDACWRILKTHINPCNDKPIYLDAVSQWPVHRPAFKRINFWLLFLVIFVDFHFDRMELDCWMHQLGKCNFEYIIRCKF